MWVLWVLWSSFWPLPTHRSQRQSYNNLNCSMKVVYYIFTSTPGVVRIHFRANPRIQVFWENQFFSFCGAPKNIFWPWKPFLALETPTLGGSYLQNFLIWAAVLEISRADFAQKWLFWTFPTSKPLLGSKSFRSMTPPKLGFLRPNKVFGVKKCF